MTISAYSLMLPQEPEGKCYKISGRIQRVTLCDPKDPGLVYEQIKPYSECSELLKRIILRQKEGAIDEAKLKMLFKRSFSKWSFYENVFLSASETLSNRLEQLGVILDDEMQHLRFYLTDGSQNGHIGHYTKGNSIFIISDAGGPYKLWIFNIAQKISKKYKFEFIKHLTHEFYHVLSRHNPELQEELYEKIGFFHCDPNLPEEVKNRQYYNSDLPYNVRRKCGDRWAMPITLIDESKCTFDGKIKRKEGSLPLPDFWEVRWFIVETDLEGDWQLVAENGGYQYLKSPPNLAEEFGVDYTVHPEEILAELFVRWVWPEKITNIKVKEYFRYFDEAFTQASSNPNIY
ncbi:MAG: hypothetical protein VX777_08415 [Chlamydiota bacterium]|nr:hypothetical protein [Chlamydiota bacterium]